MADNKKSNFVKVILFSAFVFLLFPYSTSAQTVTINGIDIPEASLNNYRAGLRSNNNGVIMSCLYFAGKYRIEEFSEDVLEVVKCSDNIDICKMAIWSIYQIGNEYCCEKLSQFIESHPSDELRNCCKFLKKIKDYDTAVKKTIQMASKWLQI